MRRTFRALLTVPAATAIAGVATAQGTTADYARAANAVERIDRATIDVPDTPFAPNRNRERDMVPSADVHP